MGRRQALAASHRRRIFLAWIFQANDSCSQNARVGGATFKLIIERLAPRQTRGRLN